MTPDELGAWLDENRVATVRTEGASLDGLVLGKHLSRDKFERSLPLGPALSDLVFAWDIGGAPQLGWWADFRQPALGDVHQRPDLSTIVVSPNRPGMANVLVDHTTIDGAPLPVCPRVVLRGVVGAAANQTMRRYELTVGARIDTAPGMVATSPPIQCRMSADRWSALLPSKKTGAPSRRSE